MGYDFPALKLGTTLILRQASILLTLGTLALAPRAFGGPQAIDLACHGSRISEHAPSPAPYAATLHFSFAGKLCAQDCSAVVPLKANEYGWSYDYDSRSEGENLVVERGQAVERTVVPSDFTTATVRLYLGSEPVVLTAQRVEQCATCRASYQRVTAIQATCDRLPFGGIPPLVPTAHGGDLDLLR